MVTKLQAGGIGVVSGKDESEARDGSRTFYTLYVDFLGTDLRLNVNADEYTECGIGDEIRVSGTPMAEGGIKLKRPTVARVGVADEAVQQGQGGGLFGGKKKAA